MAGGAFLRSRFVKQHALAADFAKYFVALVARHMFVRSLQRKGRLRIVIEQRSGLPLH